ncbi:MAG: hypothetical protein OEW83_23260 [Acidimicrobiia bacterium]|nr:hypothetical protein [Acidimicrobiia bacterium]
MRPSAGITASALPGARVFLDLMADLADLAERHGHGEHIDVVGSVDVGHYLVDVLALRAMVAMLTPTPTDTIVLALGRT